MAVLFLLMSTLLTGVVGEIPVTQSTQLTAPASQGQQLLQDLISILKQLSTEGMQVAETASINAIRILTPWWPKVKSCMGQQSTFMIKRELSITLGCTLKIVTGFGTFAVCMGWDNMNLFAGAATEVLACSIVT